MGEKIHTFFYESPQKKKLQGSQNLITFKSNENIVRLKKYYRRDDEERRREKRKRGKGKNEKKGKEKKRKRQTTEIGK